MTKNLQGDEFDPSPPENAHVDEGSLALARGGYKTYDSNQQIGDDLALVEDAEQDQRLQVTLMKFKFQLFLVTNITRMSVTIQMLTKRGFSRSIHWLSPEKAAVENISEAEPEEKVSEVDAIGFYTEVEEPEVKEGIDNKKEPVDTFWESEEKVVS